MKFAKRITISALAIGLLTSCGGAPVDWEDASGMKVTKESLENSNHFSLRGNDSVTWNDILYSEFDPFYAPDGCAIASETNDNSKNSGPEVETGIIESSEKGEGTCRDAYARLSPFEVKAVENVAGFNDKDSAC